LREKKKKGENLDMSPMEGMTREATHKLLRAVVKGILDCEENGPVHQAFEYYGIYDIYDLISFDQTTMQDLVYLKEDSQGTALCPIPYDLQRKIEMFISWCNWFLKKHDSLPTERMWYCQLYVHFKLDAYHQFRLDEREKYKAKEDIARVSEVAKKVEKSAPEVVEKGNGKRANEEFNLMMEEKSVRNEVGSQKVECEMAPIVDKEKNVAILGKKFKDNESEGEFSNATAVQITEKRKVRIATHVGKGRVSSLWQDFGSFPCALNTTMESKGRIVVMFLSGLEIAIMEQQTDLENWKCDGNKVFHPGGVNCCDKSLHTLDSKDGFVVKASVMFGTPQRSIVLLDSIVLQ
jgi:hypothetical protein